MNKSLAILGVLSSLASSPGIAADEPPQRQFTCPRTPVYAPKKILGEGGKGATWHRISPTDEDEQPQGLAGGRTRLLTKPEAEEDGIITCSVTYLGVDYVYGHDIRDIEENDILPRELGGRSDRMEHNGQIYIRQKFRKYTTCVQNETGFSCLYRVLDQRRGPCTPVEGRSYRCKIPKEHLTAGGDGRQEGLNGVPEPEKPKAAQTAKTASALKKPDPTGAVPASGAIPAHLEPADPSDESEPTTTKAAD